MHPNIQTEVNFKDFGIPEIAKILDGLYTPQDGNIMPSPAQRSINTPHRITNEILHHFALFPMTFDYNEPIKETEVALMISWIEHTVNDDSWQNLVNACILFQSGHYQSVIVPANVAVEARLGKLLTAFIEKFEDISRRQLEDFLTRSYLKNSFSVK